MIRLLHVEPNTVMRTVLKDILDVENLEVVASVARLSDIDPERADELEPDVLLISLDGADATLERLRQWRARAKPVKVLVLLHEAAPERMPVLLQAGVDGMLLAADGPAAVGRAIALVAMGEKVYPAAMDAVVAPAAPEEAECGRRGPRGLSPIERIVLGHLQAGHSNQRIALLTGQDDADVKVQVHSIFRKLKVRNRTQAALWAARNPGMLLPSSPPAGAGSAVAGRR